MTYDVPRRFARTEFRQLPWTFALKWDTAFTGNAPLRVEARNISAVGMKFMCNHRLAMFTAVEVSLFENATGKELLRLSGKVIRLEEIDTGQREKTYGVALEFDENPALEKLLAAGPTQPKTE